MKAWISGLFLVRIKAWIFGLFLVLVLAGALAYWRGASYTMHLLGQPVRSIQMAQLSHAQPMTHPTAAAQPTPVQQSNQSDSVVGANTLSSDFINQVLASYHSPAVGKGQALFDDGTSYGIDDAYALAFFLHESSMGTAGVARETLSLSNMRCVPYYDCDPEGGGYARFSSWEQGFEAWYKLIRNLYVGEWGLTTLEQIIPVYAPSSDHNDPASYIAAIKHCVETWQAGEMQC